MGEKEGKANEESVFALIIARRARACCITGQKRHPPQEERRESKVITQVSASGNRAKSQFSPVISSLPNRSDFSSVFAPSSTLDGCTRALDSRRAPPLIAYFYVDTRPRIKTKNDERSRSLESSVEYRVVSSANHPHRACRAHWCYRRAARAISIGDSGRSREKLVARDRSLPIIVTERCEYRPLSVADNERWRPARARATLVCVEAGFTRGRESSLVPTQCPTRRESAKMLLPEISAVSEWERVCDTCLCAYIQWAGEARNSMSVLLWRQRRGAGLPGATATTTTTAATGAKTSE